MHKERYILFSIKVLNNELRRFMDANKSVESPETLSHVQHGILGFLGHSYGKREVFQKDIEQEFNIRRSTATGILQGLEKNGFIVREPLPNDARMKKIIMTEKALDHHYKIEADLNRLEDQIRKDMTDEELNTFFGLLDKISNNIKQEAQHQ